MQGAYQTTKERAEAAGKRACPVCAGGTAATRQTNTTTCHAQRHGCARLRAHALHRPQRRHGLRHAWTAPTSTPTRTATAWRIASRISLLAALQNGKIRLSGPAARVARQCRLLHGGRQVVPRATPTCQGMRERAAHLCGAGAGHGQDALPRVPERRDHQPRLLQRLRHVGRFLAPAAAIPPSGGGWHCLRLRHARAASTTTTDSTCGGMRNAERVPLSAMLEPSAARPARIAARRPTTPSTPPAAAPTTTPTPPVRA